MDLIDKFNKAYLTIPNKPKVIKDLLDEDVIIFSYYKGENHPAVIQNKYEFLDMIQKHHDCCTYTEILENNLVENEDGTIQGVIKSFQKTIGVPNENNEIKNHTVFKIKPKPSEFEKYKNELKTAIYNMRTRQFFKLNSQNKICFMHHYCEPKIIKWE